jgi:protein-tyrosine kinase
VLVDSPAFDVGADAALLARATGAVMAMARNNVTRMHIFQGVVDSLTDAGVFVVGSVLIDVPAGQRAAAEPKDA